MLLGDFSPQTFQLSNFSATVVPLQPGTQNYSKWDLSKVIADLLDSENIIHPSL